MGGTGKSVLASTLARSIEVRRAFADGIFWLDLRIVPSAAAGLQTLTQILEPTADTSAIGSEPSEQKLTSLLRAKRCLLVLDNADRVDQIEAIVRCLDSTGRILVTTRKPDLVDEAHRVLLSGLDAEEARQQLADWLQLPAQQLDRDCQSILAICDGLPFAIALCGSLIASGVTPSAVASKLRSLDLAVLEKRFPDYDYPGLLACLEVSVSALEAAHADAFARFERLVVFPPGAPIPFPTLFMIWQKIFGMDAAACSFQLAQLCSFSLVRSEPDSHTVYVHQLVHGYLSLLVPDKVPFNEELLGAYAGIASPDWVHGPDDGYYHSHLVHHLLTARGVEAVFDLLVGSPDWMREKLGLQGNQLSYLADLDLAIRALDDTDANVLRLAKLAAARQLARQVTRGISPGILKAMVRLDLGQRAIELVRANVDSPTRADQLIELYDALYDRGDERTELLDEVELLQASAAGSSLSDYLVELAQRHAKAGRLDKALGLWRALQPDTRRSTQWLCVLLASLLMEAGRIPEAQSLEEEVPPAVVAATSVLHRLEAKNFDVALHRVLGVEDEIIRDVLLTRLSGALSQEREFIRARAAAHAIKRAEPRVIALAEVAWRPCLREALEMARTLTGHERVFGLIAVAARIHLCEQDGWCEPLKFRLWRWLNGLPSPDPNDTAAALMEEAEQATGQLEPRQQPPLLRILAATAFSRAHGQSRRLLQSAVQAVNQIDHQFTKANELAEIASEMARLDGDPQITGEAQALLSQAMNLVGSLSDVQATDRACTALACLLVRAGFFRHGLILAERIRDADQSRKTMQAFAAECAAAGSPDQAKLILGRRPEDPDIIRQTALAYARSGNVDVALEMAARRDDRRTFLSIAGLLAEQGTHDRALSLLGELPDGDETAYEHVGILARVIRSADAPATCAGALNQARLRVSKIRSTIYRSMALATLANAEATFDRGQAEIDFDEALRLARVEEEGLLPLQIFEPSSGFNALLRVAETMIDAGFANKVLALARLPSAHESTDEWLTLQALLTAKVAVHERRRGGLSESQSETLLHEALGCALRTENSFFIGPAWRTGALLQLAHHFAGVGWVSSGLRDAQPGALHLGTVRDRVGSVARDPKWPRLSSVPRRVVSRG
jgi:hypothetical protein